MRIFFSTLVLCLLAACGGGGGGGGAVASPASTAPVNVGTVNYPSALYSMGIGHFTAGDNYVVMAGWVSNGTNADIPVKIYKINTDGTGTDATAQLLGSEINHSVNYPIIADFNGDGIDDLFLAGFHDYPVNNYSSTVFLSQGAGQPFRRVDLPGMAWNHGVTVADLDNNGILSVVNNEGRMWLNDGHGNFTFRDHNYNVNNPNGLWMHGSGVCAGDLNRTGHTQIIITDLQVGGDLPIADTVVFELNSSRTATASHALPVPVLDRNSTTVELSHDVACRVADINGDGLPDLIVSSRPNLHARTTWTNEGVVQVLINQGNWQFADITDTAMAGYPTNVNVSYTPIVEDLNGDGKLDLWLGYFDQASGRANMAWLNNGSGIFTRALADTIDSFGANGAMVPIKVGNNWQFVYSTNTNHGLYNIFVTRPIYNF